ncbi:MAG: glycerol-3-phosphate 1-O-acyltransferase PlsY [Flavobacteriales bacterium]
MDIGIGHIGGLLLAYLIGAIPSAFLIGKALHNIDLREHGSKNLGATNTFRVLGWKKGLFVLAIDILKGWAVVFLIPLFLSPIAGSLIMLRLILGATAVLGHIFPVYMNFKGGKGVATVLGVVLAIHYAAALICLGIFLVLFLLTRYVSLGSIAAACSFPVLVILVFRAQDPALIHFSWAFALLILLTHHKNIERLIRNQENKLDFSSNGPKEQEQESH